MTAFPFDVGPVPHSKGKRVMDVGLAVLSLIAAAPLMAAVAIAVKLQDGGPVLFRQQRLTENGRVFTILKFRSMRVDAEADGVARLACEGDARITPVGQFLRRTHIDELPQLINILRGDMSLVGPRPERPELAAQYEKALPEYALRLQVKAGLTGYAQVYGTYDTPPEEKLRMDLWYITHQSAVLDWKLIAMTAAEELRMLLSVCTKTECESRINAGKQV